jgi:hypothetical protein
VLVRDGTQSLQRFCSIVVRAESSQGPGSEETIHPLVTRSGLPGRALLRPAAHLREPHKLSELKGDKVYR